MDPPNLFFSSVQQIFEPEPELLVQFKKFRFKPWFRTGDVPAQLGLKVRASAWPEMALAFKIVKPSHEPKPGLGFGLKQLLVQKWN
jgi:hypothetical protein